MTRSQQTTPMASRLDWQGCRFLLKQRGVETTANAEWWGVAVDLGSQWRFSLAHPWIDSGSLRSIGQLRPPAPDLPVHADDDSQDHRGPEL